MMQAPAGSLTIADGRVVTDRAAGTSMSLGDPQQARAGVADTRCARPGAVGRTLVPCRPASLSVRHSCGDGAGGSRDRRRHGRALIIGYVSAAPSIRRWCVGQIVGGFTQGPSGRLEEFSYGDHGDPLSSTLADYLMPTARDVRERDIILSEELPPAQPARHQGHQRAESTRSAQPSRRQSMIRLPGAIRSFRSRRSASRTFSSGAANLPASPQM